MTIDRVFLGQFSTDALAAAISALGIFWAPMALLQQTAAYVTTFIAQYSGSKQPHRIGPAVWQGIHFSIVGGLLFLLFLPVSEPLFTWIDHSENIRKLEKEYFDALLFSALPAAIVAAVSGFFIGMNKSSVVMVINAVGLVVNAVLDYILILGNWGSPAYGIAGAGYATAIANFAAAGVGLALFMGHKYQVQFGTRTGFGFDKDLFRRLMRYGLPSGLQWSFEGLAFTIFLVFIGRMPGGDAGLAASSITVTIYMLAILPALGVAQASAVLVGQHLGENRPWLSVRATWAGLKVACVYIVAVVITFFVFPEFYLKWFQNDENKTLWAEVSAMVPILLRFVALFSLFDSINVVVSFALKGAGDTRYVTAVALVLPWPLMVLPTWLVENQSNGIYLAWGAASVFIITQALVFLVRFRGGKWQSMRVIEMPPESAVSG